MKTVKNGRIYDVNNLTQHQVWNLLLDERSETADLRDEMNKDFKESYIVLFTQKREFLNNLLAVTGIIVGLSPFTEHALESPIYRAGLLLQIVTVVLILLYNRESIDLDSMGMQKLQDKLNGVAEAKIKLVEEYLEKKEFTPAAFLKFKQDLPVLPEMGELARENEKLTASRKNRNDQSMDFFGELSIFLFTFSAFLIVFGLLGCKVSLWQIVLIGMILTYITFGDFLAYVSRPLNKKLTFLKKKGIFLDGTKLK